MRRFVVLCVAVAVAGCMSVAPATSVAPLSADRANELAGSWQGWLVMERSFALFTFDIRADGTFQVTGQWTRAEGVLVTADGTLRFDGTGAWHGTLTLERGGKLKLERDDRLVPGSLHRVGQPG
jgi:hypothetical protein